MRQAGTSIVILVFVALWLTVSPAHANDNIHVVEPGETLSEIAVAYDTNVETLRSLNDLSDIDLVWVGLPLILPFDAITDASEPETTTVGPDSYTVEPGDTLSSIAMSHRMSLAQLIALNRVSPARSLFAGEVLALRDPGQSVLEADVLETDALETDVFKTDVLVLPQSDRVHVVQAGEHLGTIAETYTTSARKIAEINGLSNASLVTPGQELRIPPPSFDEMAKLAPIGDDGYHTHPAPLDATEKWIDVDLSEQRVVAYEGAVPVADFLVSTGKQATPTVTGTFRIWAKTPVQDMYGGNRAAGDYYFLEDVEWVQYFHEDFGFHGAYWHDNFGQPMSRGCVNMRNADAEWLYDWAGPTGADVDKNGWVVIDQAYPGTLVVVHE